MRPVRTPASRAAPTAAIIPASGPLPANRRSIRPLCSATQPKPRDSTSVLLASLILGRD